MDEEREEAEPSPHFAPIQTPTIVLGKASAVTPSKRVKVMEEESMRRKGPFASNSDNAEASIDPSAVPKVSYVSQKSSTSACGLSIYEEDSSTMPTIAAYLRSFTVPGPTEHDQQSNLPTKKKKAKLGTLLGVYLPTIQHILGVQMFLRLAWIVGVGGILESFTMVFVCCLCTFLTSISISAIATNGVIDSGGAYFMISRNLGPSFGGAVGVLYYLANAVATAMYLVGGVEILLMYMAPGLPQFGDPGHHNEADMFNNFRVYASGLLLLEFIVVAMGVKFVQFFAPISLACVVVSILSVYAGPFAASPETSPMLCMLGDRVLKVSAYTRPNGTVACSKDAEGPLWASYCGNGTSGGWESTQSEEACDPYFLQANISYVAGIPGFYTGLIQENFWSKYLKYGESATGQIGDGRVEVVQDITTTFFIILAIFFPSVTGIFTGANMSGDLKDAQKSLPVGTLAAQLTTSFVYLSFVLVFGASIHGALLRDKYGESLNGGMVVAKLAWPNEWVLLVGSFTSTFGAALQCLCSAPRLLQSIAKDDVIPFLRMFSVVTKGGEPVRALFLSTLIGEIAVLIGGIDYIAPVVDFFFLMCYCFVNIVCALQTLLNVPNWRPRFRFYHWSLSLLGALLCLFIMFSTFWYFALVVLALCAFLYKYIEYKGAKKEWGDGLRGLALSTAQYSLLRVEESHMHPKNWRPQLLVLVKLSKAEKESNDKLLQLAGQLKAGQGLTIVGTLVEGDTRVQQDRDRAELDRERLKKLMAEHKVKGFAHVVLCQHASENVGTLIQCVGIGGLRPNTVMVNWPTHWKDNLAKRDEEHWNFVDSIHRAAAMDICLLVPKGMEQFPEQNDRLTGTIDVWWIMHDGGLLILLPFLLKQHKVWRQCKLRVFAVAQLQDNSVKMKQDLQRWVYQLRIEAAVDVVEFADSTISAYTYERTLMMEERSRLAHDYKLSRVEMEHEPQLLVDRSRSFVNLSTLDTTTSRLLHPDGHHHVASAPHATGLASAAKRVGFKLSFTRSPKPSRAHEIQPSPSMRKHQHADGVNEKCPLAVDHSNDEKMPPVFHIAPRKAGVTGGMGPLEDSDYFNASEPPSPTAVSPDNGKNGGEPVVFTFSPRDWREEMEKMGNAGNEEIENDEQTEQTMAPTQTPRRPNDHAAAAIPTDESSAAKIHAKFANLDKKKVRKMHSAVKLNRAIQERSSESQLVVINLPRPPRMRDGLGNYMEYLEAMTDGLSRVLLVRGTGKEVITMYS